MVPEIPSSDTSSVRLEFVTQDAMTSVVLHSEVAFAYAAAVSELGTTVVKS